MTDETNAGNPLLYTMEGAACISVIFIHCMLPSWAGILICGLARFAVPLFFLVSGYYLCRDTAQDAGVRRRAEQKAKHLAALLAQAAGLYLLWSLLSAFLKGGTAQVQTKLGEIFNLRQLFATVVLGDFTPVGGHLWFLAALLVCYGIIARSGIAVFAKNGGRLAAALLTIHVAARAVCAAFSVDRLFGIPVYLWFRNWLFMGLPFLLLGDWFRRNQERLTRKWSGKTLAGIFLLGVVLTLLETAWVAARTGDDRELYIGTFLMLFSLFLSAWKEPQRAGENLLARIGKNDLLEIYLVHLWVIEAVNLFLFRTGIWIPGIGWLKPLLVLLLSAALSAAWNKAKKRARG